MRDKCTESHHKIATNNQTRGMEQSASLASPHKNGVQQRIWRGQRVGNNNLIVMATLCASGNGSRGAIQAGWADNWEAEEAPAAEEWVLKKGPATEEALTAGAKVKEVALAAARALCSLLIAAAKVLPLRCQYVALILCI